MKSYWIENRDSKLFIDLREVNKPQAAAGQLLVKIYAAGLNRGEFIVGAGPHGSLPYAKPMGMEAAGEIIDIGKNVTGFNLGQRVMGRCPGGFSEFGLMLALEAMPIPDSLNWTEAASIPITFMVAYDVLIEQGELKAGEWLMINGVSSGVGTACVQLAKVLGAHTIGTSLSDKKLKLLISHGLTESITTRSPDFYARVLEITKEKGVNLVVNAVGGSLLAEEIRCLAYKGRLAIVGYVDGFLEAPLAIETLHSNRLKIFGVSNKNRTPEERQKSVVDFVTNFLPRFSSNDNHPLVDRIFTFDQLQKAKDYMESNQHLGKIILSVHEK